MLFLLAPPLSHELLACQQLCSCCCFFFPSVLKHLSFSLFVNPSCLIDRRLRRDPLSTWCFLGRSFLSLTGPPPVLLLFSGKLSSPHKHKPSVILFLLPLYRRPVLLRFACRNSFALISTDSLTHYPVVPSYPPQFFFFSFYLLFSSFPCSRSSSRMYLDSLVVYLSPFPLR